MFVCRLGADLNHSYLYPIETIMPTIRYLPFDQVSEIDFISLLNRPKIREHLMEHGFFDESTIKEWIKSKLEVDTVPGCRLRAIVSDNRLVGWCGIQLENKQYELAVVLDESVWGLGKQVFAEMMTWAKEFGLQSVYLHLLNTRPEYKFLSKMAKRVFNSTLYGNQFTTYEIAVS